jgi:hypothetical protein
MLFETGDTGLFQKIGQGKFAGNLHKSINMTFNYLPQNEIL